MADRFEANTVLYSFNTIQPSSLLSVYYRFTAKSVGERNGSVFGKVRGKNIVAFFADTV